MPFRARWTLSPLSSPLYPIPNYLSSILMFPLLSSTLNKHNIYYYYIYIIIYQDHYIEKEMHTSKSLQMKHFEISNLASFPVCPWSHTWPWYGLSLRNINGKLDHGFKLQFLKRRLIGSMPNCYPLQELWSVMLVIKREDWSGSSGLESGRCVCWSIDNRLQLSETPQRSVFFWKNMYHDRYGTVTGPLRGFR